MHDVNIKPIRTHQDLTAAKHRLKSMLLENSSGSYDDEIEVLAVLIEQFERTYHRVDAPTPIASIKFRMEEMGLSPRQIEPFIGSRARVSEVLSGKRQLSIDMIRSLHEGLGIPYESLISQRSKNAIIEQISSPKLNHLDPLGSEVDYQKPSVFIRTSQSQSIAPALLRKTRTQRAASKTDQGALLLWQATVLKSCAAPNDQKFKYVGLSPEYLRQIARMSAKPDGPRRAISALKEAGVSVVTLPPLPGTFLDGAAMLGESGNPVIGLTLRHDRIDSFWFTLLHELAHVFLHHEELRSGHAGFVDDLEIRSDDRFECEADQLARESLIPNQILAQMPWNASTSQDDIIAIASRARTHIAVVAGRWQRDHQNYKKFARLIERGTVRTMLSSAGDQ